MEETVTALWQVIDETKASLTDPKNSRLMEVAGL